MSFGFTPPPVSQNIQVWAQNVTTYLQRVASRLAFKGPESRATENGVILWDNVEGYPVVSRDAEWRRISLSDVVFVASPSDLPAPVSGVITLEANATYYFTAIVDLLGDRLVCSANTVLIGSSSENCGIKSTGLALGTALISSAYSLPIRHLSLEAATILDLDAAGNATQAHDWYGVNLVNSADVGTIANYTNFIGVSIAMLNASGLVFDGEFDTVSFEGSIFTASSGTIISLPSTVTINRRFRVIYSAVVATGTSTGIDVSTSASVPVEGYILDTVDFGGGATYTAGVTYLDNKARWAECRGVRNTSAVTSYYMHGNATATTIGSVGVPVKVAGTTTGGALSSKFDNSTTNRSVYQGAIVRGFTIRCVFSLSSGNGDQIGVYFAKNGTVLSESDTHVTTNASGRLENGSLQALTELEDGDYIEVFVENNSHAADVTVRDMHIIITAETA